MKKPNRIDALPADIRLKLVKLREDGKGKRTLATWLNDQGYKDITPDHVQTWLNVRKNNPTPETIASNVFEFAADFTDSAKLAALNEWFDGQGITPPPAGFIGATVEQNSAEVLDLNEGLLDGDGNPLTPELIKARKKHWIRVKNIGPDITEETQILLKEPEPVNVTLIIPDKRKRKLNDLQCAVLYPDAQMWYYEDRDGQLKPVHDESAINVANQIAVEVQQEHGINEMIDLGDLVDFPILGKHRSSPSTTVKRATNATLARAAEYFAVRAAIAPDARKRILEGNHDTRLYTWLIDHADQMIGIQPGGDPEPYPLISLERMTGSYRYGWEWVGPYPEGVIWLSHNLRCIHGTTVRPTAGATNETYLNEQVSTFYGHTHRAGMDFRTWHTNMGPRTFVAYSPGCLCRITGEVPSASTGHSSYGTPGKTGRGEKWTQGFGIVFFDPEGHAVPVIEHVPIFGGKATWRGKQYVSTVDADGLLIA